MKALRLAFEAYSSGLRAKPLRLKMSTAFLVFSLGDLTF